MDTWNFFENAFKIFQMENEIKWSIDPAHSEITFKVRHLMIAHVRGAFKKFDADIRTIGSDFGTATIDLWIDPSSIDTADEKRDAHLKSSDFFDVLNHKSISFSSKSISRSDGTGNYEMLGELSIRGISKDIKLSVTSGGIIQDPWGNERAGFNVSGKINRKDWKLNWNNTLQAGGVLVGDEININCEIELVHTKEEHKLMELETADEEKKGI
jgi:polyisoprenoid-binding protein YceI